MAENAFCDMFFHFKCQYDLISIWLQIKCIYTLNATLSCLDTFMLETFDGWEVHAHVISSSGAGFTSNSLNVLIYRSIN